MAAILRTVFAKEMIGNDSLTIEIGSLSTHVNNARSLAFAILYWLIDMFLIRTIPFTTTSHHGGAFSGYGWKG